MSGLQDTLDAVTELLQPLVPDTLKQVATGPHEQISTFPRAWVWYGPATVIHEPAGRTALERQTIRQVKVRIYEKRNKMLPQAYASLVGLIDAVTNQLNSAPVIDDVADRFGATGYSEPVEDQYLPDTIYVDVTCAALWTDADTYQQDWS